MLSHRKLQATCSVASKPDPTMKVRLSFTMMGDTSEGSQTVLDPGQETSNWVGRKTR